MHDKYIIMPPIDAFTLQKLNQVSHTFVLYHQQARRIKPIEMAFALKPILATIMVNLVNAFVRNDCPLAFPSISPV